MLISVVNPTSSLSGYQQMECFVLVHPGLPGLIPSHTGADDVSFTHPLSVPFSVDELFIHGHEERR